MRKRWMAVLIAAACLLHACAPAALTQSAAATLAPAPPQEMAAPATVAPATATPTQEPTPTPAPAPFSVAWVSDTQNLNGVRFAALESMYAWMTRVQAEQRILAYAHTGDVVQNVYDTAHWELNKTAAERLPADILRVTACGNHDWSPDPLGYDNYLKYRFDSPIPPENLCGDGVSFYQTLDAGGMKLLFLSIGYFTEQRSAAWACEVLNAHPEHFGVLLAHSYLIPNQYIAEEGYTSGGFLLRDSVVRQCPNLRMVLCGHNPGLVDKTVLYDDDGDGTPERKVIEMMMNFQNEGEPGRRGFMRLLRFDPVADTVTVVTYSPYLDDGTPLYQPRLPDVVFEDAGLLPGA